MTKKWLDIGIVAAGVGGIVATLVSAATDLDTSTGIRLFGLAAILFVLRGVSGNSKTDEDSSAT